MASAPASFGFIALSALDSFSILRNEAEQFVLQWIDSVIFGTISVPENNKLGHWLRSNATHELINCVFALAYVWMIRVTCTFVRRYNGRVRVERRLKFMITRTTRKRHMCQGLQRWSVCNAIDWNCTRNTMLVNCVGKSLYGDDAERSKRACNEFVLCALSKVLRVTLFGFGERMSVDK